MWFSNLTSPGLPHASGCRKATASRHSSAWVTSVLRMGLSRGTHGRAMTMIYCTHLYIYKMDILDHWFRVFFLIFYLQHLLLDTVLEHLTWFAHLFPSMSFEVLTSGFCHPFSSDSFLDCGIQPLRKFEVETHWNMIPLFKTHRFTKRMSNGHNIYYIDICNYVHITHKWFTTEVLGYFFWFSEARGCQGAGVALAAKGRYAPKFDPELIGLSMLNKEGGTRGKGLAMKTLGDDWMRKYAPKNAISGCI